MGECEAGAVRRNTYRVEGLIGASFAYDGERQVAWDAKDGHQKEDGDDDTDGQAHGPIALVGRG